VMRGSVPAAGLSKTEGIYDDVKADLVKIVG
jgi:hypothetical protein